MYGESVFFRANSKARVFLLARQVFSKSQPVSLLVCPGAHSKAYDRLREVAQARLESVQAGLARLDYKIAHYDELIAR